ncbi:MAG: hypothetical protein JW932_20770 [Deltaproteobacteria bacterium]|nr:hypothetical protein [Deltaproteobacteria bacterium]
MVQDLEVRDQEQVEVWVEAAAAKVAVAKAEGVVLLQARGAIVSAPNAGKERPIKQECPVMSSYALNVEQL